jgi:ribosome-associated protein
VQEKAKKGVRAGREEVETFIEIAWRAAEEKKAEELVALDLRGLASFTDYFIICHGRSERQVQAIGDQVEEELRKAGVRPFSIEGYQRAEWVLMDYSDFVVHIFSEKRREFYGLERLWGDARRLQRPAGR